jgi:hypothetical protein
MIKYIKSYSDIEPQVIGRLISFPNSLGLFTPLSSPLSKENDPTRESEMTKTSTCNDTKVTTDHEGKKGKILIDSVCTDYVCFG